MYSLGEVMAWTLIGVGIGFTFAYTLGRKDGLREGIAIGWRRASSVRLTQSDR